MKLDDLIFILATVILWLPFPSLSDRFRSRSLLAHFSSPEMTQVCRSWHGYVDWTRSILGGFVVVRMSLDLQSGALGFEPILAWLPTAVLAVGLIFQTVRLPVPLILMAPIFYLSGLTLILPGSLEGAFALLFGWGFAIGTKDIRHQLPAMGFALLLAGVCNNNLNYWLLVTAAFILTPPALSVLSGKRLVIHTTDSRYSRRHAKAAQGSLSQESRPSAQKLAQLPVSSSS
jgi:hypothetical protein